jgi:hypothetical protein
MVKMKHHRQADLLMSAVELNQAAKLRRASIGYRLKMLFCGCFIQDEPEYWEMRGDRLVGVYAK